MSLLILYNQIISAVHLDMKICRIHQNYISEIFFE